MQTVYITTPVFNGADDIDRSIQHVLMQSGDFRLRYHVQDGGSTDATVEKLTVWQNRLARHDFPLFCAGVDFTFASEPDASMYDAVTKGFAALDDAPDDAFMTWINHDDLLLPGACALAAALAHQFSRNEVAWFTGLHNATSHDGAPIPKAPAPLPQRFIADGLADLHLLAPIQQEGTFFRKWLWDAAAPAEAMGDLRRAGDWNLWRIMARHAKLYQVEWMHTGRFSYRKGQMSDDRSKYLDEINGIVSQSDRVDRFIALMKTEDLATPCLHYDSVRKRFVTRDRAGNRIEMLKFAAQHSQAVQHVLDHAIKDALADTDRTETTAHDATQAAEHVRVSLERLSRFELMSPNGVKRAVDSSITTTQRWRTEFVKAPLQVSRWLALRRVERRLKRRK